MFLKYSFNFSKYQIYISGITVSINEYVNLLIRNYKLLGMFTLCLLKSIFISHRLLP